MWKNTPKIGLVRRWEKKSKNNKKERNHIETLLDEKLDLASLLCVEEYDDVLVRHLVSSIKVKADWSMEIWFKMGMVAKEKMQNWIKNYYYIKREREGT